MRRGPYTIAPRAARLAALESAADRARTTRDAWLRRLAEDSADAFERRALRDEIASAEAALIRCASVARVRCGA
jgi:hypothetical protein